MGLAPVERRVAPQGSAMLATPGADAFGAATGRSLAQLGETIDQVRRNEENAKAGEALAKYRTQATKDVQAYRDNANAGGEAHEEIVANYLDTNGRAILDTIRDPRVRQRAQAELTAFNEGMRTREALWEGGQRVKKLGADESAAQTTAFGRIATAGSLADLGPILAEETEAGHARIDGYEGINADQKVALRREFDQGVQRATLGMATRVDPRAAEAMLARGAFDELPAGELEQGFRAIGVEQRRQQAAAEHQQALHKAAVREQVATVSARIAAGEDVPDDEMAGAAAQAEAIGDTSGAVRLRGEQVKAAVNRETQDWTPGQFASRIQGLRAKGEKRSATEDVELAQLEAIAGPRATEFRRDPGAWASRMGLAPPVLTPGDAASVAARRRWQAAVSEQTKLPTPFLQPQEVEDLQAQLGQGPRARVEVANTLATFGGMTAVQAARQVAPDDAMLARLVVLRPGDRAAVSNGSEARKANHALIDGAGANSPGGQARAAFLRRMGPAARLMGQGDVDAAFEVARNLYADYAVKNGVQAFKPETFNAFIHRALGGTKDADGRWHGGIGRWGEAPVLLPQRMSQAEFDTTLSRMTWAADAPTAPAWRNGKAMTAADVRRYVPVARPDGRYEFHDPERPGIVLQTRSGAIWALDIGRLHDRYRR